MNLFYNLIILTCVLGITSCATVVNDCNPWTEYPNGTIVFDPSRCPKPYSPFYPPYSPNDVPPYIPHPHYTPHPHFNPHIER